MTGASGVSYQGWHDNSIQHGVRYANHGNSASKKVSSACVNVSKHAMAVTLLVIDWGPSGYTIQNVWFCLGPRKYSCFCAKQNNLWLSCKIYALWWVSKPLLYKVTWNLFSRLVSQSLFGISRWPKQYAPWTVTGAKEDKYIVKGILGFCGVGLKVVMADNTWGICKHLAETGQNVWGL